MRTIEEKEKIIWDRHFTLGIMAPVDLVKYNIPYDYFYFDNIDRAVDFIDYIEENFKKCKLDVTKGYITHTKFCIMIVADSNESLNLIKLTANL